MDRLRKLEQLKLNSEAAERNVLESRYSQVWNPEELQRDYEVEGFAAPYVVVIRKEDKVKGSLAFQHSPRYYFDFSPHN